MDFLVTYDKRYPRESMSIVGANTEDQKPLCLLCLYQNKSAGLMLHAHQTDESWRAYSQTDAPPANPPPDKIQGRRIVALDLMT